MADATYNVIVPEKGLPIKAWTKGVQLEDQARQQLLNVAQLPFIFKWIAAMPDVHWGVGATVGSVRQMPVKSIVAWPNEGDRLERGNVLAGSPGVVAGLRRAARGIVTEESI